ncbi:FHA domain-containing protein [Kitasatospora sp. NPDC089509]|uniref:FHA domain-containing protein n=1 Tax=Kitasatospora sp. NPDC089509 TaxID=3364079 RepID=UPI00382C11F1
MREQRWVVEVHADQAYYRRNLALYGAEYRIPDFPADRSVRRIPITGEGRFSIGRSLSGRHRVPPEIDLALDPGVGYHHGHLQQQDDGSLVLIAQETANGTFMNGSGDEVELRRPIGLRDGDRIHLGVWTTITVRTVPR